MPVAAFRLVHLGTGVEIDLPNDDSELTIGRPGGDPDIDVSGFPDATVVSRRHARIALRAGQHTIADVGAANGTYVNNVRVGAPTPLGDGDHLALGQGAKVVFEVKISP
jgi:pSer/pThr/pTyr-binding forkhead associated (FHA) protein